MTSEILLIDTFSLLFRAHHALPAMNRRDGLPTAALYGMSVLLLKLLRERRPRGIAFAYEGGDNLRRQRLPTYKASRPPMPQELVAQLPHVETLRAAFGAPRLAAHGFEADDVLATVARELRDRGEAACIVSGDRDLLAVAKGSTRVLFIGRRGQDHVEYDQAAVERRFGVTIERMATFIALIGDPSDNLPGVPGVGPKTAARWISLHGDIDAIVAAAPALEPARLCSVVRAHADALRAAEDVARLEEALPLVPTPRYALVTSHVWPALRELFEDLEFTSLLARLDELASS